MNHRIERDPLGEQPVPADAYYGIQTGRALENFPISGLRAQPELVTATVLVKKAAARANMALGRLDATIGDAIVAAADEVLGGAASRSVRRRRLSGRRRHVAQHERERGARQPRRRAARRRARRLRRACIRTITSTWASPPTTCIPTATRLALLRRRPTVSSTTAKRLAAALDAKARAVRARAEGRPHASAGRGADHARPGVQRLRGVRSRAAPTTSSVRRRSCSS